MKFLRSLIHSRYPWAIASGLLLAIAFPKAGVAGFAWIAPGLMLLAAIGKTGRASFRIGYIAGFAYYLASLYWLLLIPSTGFPILAWLALAAFLALYPATWVWLAWKLFPAKITGEGPASTIENYCAQFLSTAWARRLLWALTCAALWVALEMMVSRFLGGFPWNLLGSSQYRLVPLIQVASVTGIYGISFLLIWVSASMVSAMTVIVRKPAMRSAWIAELMLPMLAVSLLYAIGYERMLRREKDAPELTVALIQPSIPQSLIWDANEDSNRFAQLLQLSEQALQSAPNVVIWPEAAVPRELRYDDEINRAVTGMAKKNHVWMIVSSDDEEPNRANPKEDFFYNSSFLVSPAGQLVERYNKRNLVIFGEYIPLIRWLPFLKYLTPIKDGFHAGDRVVPFNLNDLHVKISVLICFEDVFPQLVREYVSDDTDFLVNLTNDGWFGDSAAQWQHAAAAVFRAVENNVPLALCSNNGLTGWVDSRGRLREVFQSENRGVYGPGFLIAHIPILSPGQKRTPTYYRLHGDVFGWVCVVFALLQIVRISVMRRKESDS